MKPIQVGDRVHVRNEDRSAKVWGTVTEMHAHTEEIDVTRSGLFGGPVDNHRVRTAGRTSVLITIEVEL